LTAREECKGCAVGDVEKGWVDSGQEWKGLKRKEYCAVTFSFK